MSISALADRMVRETMIENRVKRPDAERLIAREVGIAPGTLENLRRGRLVHVDWIANKITDASIRRTERQIARLESELAVARISSRRPDEDRVLAAAASVAQARRILKGEMQ